MAELYGAVREWDLVAETVVVQPMPARTASGLKPLAAASVAAAILLLLPVGIGLGIRSGVAFGVRLGAAEQLSQPFTTAVPAGFDQLFGPVLGQAAAAVWSRGNPAAMPADPSAIPAAMHPWLIACGVVTVFGGCFALLRIVARLAAVDAIGLAAGALLIGATFLDRGTTLLSGEPLFGGSISATQVATTVVLFCLASASAGSLAMAVGLLGVALDLQPAVAFWGIAGLAGASLALARDGVPVARSGLVGGVCALVLAAPALLWFAGALAHGSFAADPVASLGLAASPGLAASAALPASAVPAWAVPAWAVPGSAVSAWGVSAGAVSALAVPLDHWVLFGSALALGLSAFGVLGPDARALCGTFLGLLVIVALGCVLPLLGADRWLPMLRPMGVDMLLQVIAVVAASAVVLRDLRGGGGVLRVALSVAIAVCLLLHPYLLPLAALAMLARAAAAHGELLGLERRIRDCNQATLCRVALAVVAAAGVAGEVLRCVA